MKYGHWEIDSRGTRWVEDKNPVILYPNHAGAKERNGTSELAAEKIEKSGKAKAMRERVLALFVKNLGKYGGIGTDGLTADEVAEALSESVLSIRPRCAELIKQGKLEKTNQTRPNALGSQCRVLRMARP